MEFNHIVVNDVDMNGDVEENEDNPVTPDPPIWFEIMRFFTNPHKPMILALGRPDLPKNILTLVKAFGECHPLRKLRDQRPRCIPVSLCLIFLVMLRTLILGNCEIIDEMSGTSAMVLTSILELIDKYDLYGQVAYPKHHKQSRYSFLISTGLQQRQRNVRTGERLMEEVAWMSSFLYHECMPNVFI